MAISTVYLARGDLCVAVPAGTKNHATRAALRLVERPTGWECEWCRVHYFAYVAGCPRCNHPLARKDADA